MPRRFQFSLKTMLVAMLVVPPTGYWLVRSRQEADAAHEYLAMSSSYEAGTATFQQVYDCSRRLRDAEIAVPFANRRSALVGYLNRLARLEDLGLGELLYATLGEGTTDALTAQVKAIAAERQNLEAELGIKAKSSFRDS